jgi:hypothetical protein
MCCVSNVKDTEQVRRLFAIWQKDNCADVWARRISDFQQGRLKLIPGTAIIRGA